LQKPGFFKLRGQSGADLRLLVEAFFWLALARFALVAMPFRWTANLLTLEAGDSTVREYPFCDLHTGAFVRRAGRALTLAAARTPWKSNCAAKAVAGAGMLRCRNIPATVALGVNTPLRPVTAHAWLSAGGIVITGAPGHKKYRVIATFAYHPTYPGSSQCTTTQPFL
jgi:transglutaminase superfamily protein